MKEIITIMDKLENISVMGNNEYKKWSKSTEKDGWCKKINVEEIENGYLVCLEEYGEKDGKYQDSYKKYYSQSNPLDGMKPDEGANTDELEKAIKNFLDY
jgi:major membrane immunogen (membrane-anchored lipoprotein)